ncbi:ABC-type nitrate/sulfonate/bicarbonate transport system, permease component [Rathayibacter oskolensis]|uniref:ABC-type nitrate/sulfonate/bicarbonate transport system, permease component n=1 Tax=Rathayibacter oskolensis TaxID=1891671 RepID=A0A1X7P6Y4_9MICO|nr:ABC transporter permease subunit [Rathayibacter oskolensis]SMH46576.1 ABC-type nitrate/sulfonate/bicarbonate transport system, permease component [Rathayibacter oskolensis]
MTTTSDRTVQSTETSILAVDELRRQLRNAALGATLKSLRKSALIALSTVVIVLAIWIGIIVFSGVSPYVIKGPWDVWNHLVTDEEAAAHRADLGGLFAVTMWDSFIGFAAGLAAAIVVAILFRLSKGIEHALMPFALLLRSVPLIAMAPLIILVFGQGTIASVAVVGGIVVLFPALVTIAFGLSNASPQMLDVVSVYGGSTFTAIRKVAIPGALPSLFAAVRISVPGAITGALLAEWLSTGNGIGGTISAWSAQARFDDVWSAVVLVTGVSLVLYMVVQVIETFVLSRMSLSLS